MSDQNINITTSHTRVKTYEDDTTLFSMEEFTVRAEISLERAKELFDLGWLQAIDPEAEHLQFKAIDVAKAQKANKLCQDFEMPSMAGAIIVDLMEKIDELEARLKKYEHDK